MSHSVEHSSAEAFRLRIETLRNYHRSVVRSGEQRLRAAMEEYARQFAQHEREAA